MLADHLQQTSDGVLASIMLILWRTGPHYVIDDWASAVRISKGEGISLTGRVKVPKLDRRLEKNSVVGVNNWQSSPTC